MSSFPIRGGTNSSRYFPVPHFKPVVELSGNAIDKKVYLSVATSLARKCWGDDPTSRRILSSTRENDGLYCGTLGRLCFLRLRLAWYYIALSSDTVDKAEITTKDTFRRHSDLLLDDGLRETQRIITKLQQRSASIFSSSDRRCTLLEGPLIGSLALQSVFLHLLRGSPENQLHDDVKKSTQDLLRVGKQIIIEGNLDRNECEVLYGRCGYLHAILFIRKHLSIPSYGQDIALAIIDQVLETGIRNAASAKHETDLHGIPLLWLWHGKVYLGACHGISGILYTVLHFVAELEMLSNQRGVDYLSILKTTLDKINETQIFSSTTNLASSYGSQRDELVQWCHGAPGHIFLLLRAHEVFKEDNYLELAKISSQSTIFNRGLLRKGLGLCHGISGNAFAFLSIYRYLKKINDHEGAETWLRKACFFADFGIEKLHELEFIPDRPYSLYEGVAGFACLLVDLLLPDDKNCGFPCYEVDSP